MRKQWKWTTGTVLAAVVVLGAALPAMAADGAKGEDCDLCALKHSVTDTFEWLKVGLDFRARGYYDNAVTTLNRDIAKDAGGHERVWQRVRTRANVSIDPGKLTGLDLGRTQFNVGMAWEWFNFFRPKSPRGAHLRSTNFNEAIFETFNVKISDLEICGVPTTLVLGRQNIVGINNWLILDGTPMDGSRTIYFDAARATFDLKEYKSTLEAIYINQAADPKRFIKPINDRDWFVTGQNEIGAIFYLKNKSIENTQVDAYFIYKHNMKVVQNHVYFVNTNDADIYTVGVRVAGELDENLSYGVDVAPQWGEKDNEDIITLGAKADLTYKLGDEMKTKIFGTYEYRGGGKTTSGSFDVLWGKYPQFSNIFNGYTDRLEGDWAASSNLHRVTVGCGIAPVEDVTVEGSYSALFADRNNLANAAPGGIDSFSSTGMFRGHLLAGVVKHTINHHLAHEVMGEVFFPGNYYSSDRDSTAVMAWYQIVFKW